MLGDDIAAAATLSRLLNFPDLTSRRTTTTTADRNSIPTDIVETNTEYVFYLDVPGVSKTDVQLTVEEERTLVVKSNGKRKREDEEECKYIRLERRGKENLVMKFRLPEDANVDVVSAKCENGVLKISVGKNPLPAKGKTVQVKIE